MRLQKAFERVYVVDCSDGFRDGVPDDWSSNREKEAKLLLPDAFFEQENARKCVFG